MMRCPVRKVWQMQSRVDSDGGGFAGDEGLGAGAVGMVPVLAAERLPRTSCWKPPSRVPAGFGSGSG